MAFDQTWESENLACYPGGGTDGIVSDHFDGVQEQDLLNQCPNRSVPTAKAARPLRSDEEDLAGVLLRPKGAGHVVGTLPHVTLRGRVGRRVL